MPSYPISLSVPSSLTKRRLSASIGREYATRIENYLNDHCQNEPECEFDYGQLANELGIDKKTIKRFLAPIGGGSNGITISNPKLKNK